VVASLVFCLACTREDVSNNASQSTTNVVDPRTTSGDNSSTMNPVMPPQQDAPGSQAAGAATTSQPVELNEYSIRMPSSLAPGPQAFTIANGGKELHSFEIEGNGVRARLPSDLPRGDSAKLELDLKPGTYTVYCPIDGHRAKGMETTITVR
jgi:hypothetical protein